MALTHAARRPPAGLDSAGARAPAMPTARSEGTS